MHLPLRFFRFGRWRQNLNKKFLQFNKFYSVRKFTIKFYSFLFSCGVPLKVKISKYLHFHFSFKIFIVYKKKKVYVYIM
jgi:hypothetical protein